MNALGCSIVRFGPNKKTKLAYQPETALWIRIINGTVTLEINNSFDMRSRLQIKICLVLRALVSSAKNPNPVTNQSVNTVTSIVGVFIGLDPYCLLRHGNF